LLALAISAINITELCFDYHYIPYIAQNIKQEIVASVREFSTRATFCLWSTLRNPV